MKTKGVILMNDQKVYLEEYSFIFSNKGSGVRKVLVLSALIEEQIFLLVEQLFLRHSLEFSFKTSQNFYQLVEVLKLNNVILETDEIAIKKFREERNKAVHKIFKGMTRAEWNELNKHVIELGRPIVEKLEKKLYAENKELD